MTIAINVRNYTNTASPTPTTIAIGVSDATITLTGISNYPEAPFTACLERNTTNQEFLLVTGYVPVSGSTASLIPTNTNAVYVTRGFNGTAAIAHIAGVTFEHCTGAIDYQEANEHHTDSTRDDHQQYLPLTAARSLTGGLNGTTAQFSGNVTIGGNQTVAGNQTINGGISGTSATFDNLSVTDLNAQSITNVLTNIPSGRIYVSNGIVMNSVSSTVVEGTLVASFLKGGIKNLTSNGVGPLAFTCPIAGIYQVNWALHIYCSNSGQNSNGYVISSGGQQGAWCDAFSVSGQSFTIGASDALYVPANGTLTLYGAAEGSGYTWVYDLPYNYFSASLVSQ